MREVHSLMASETASFNVPVPVDTPLTSAPSSLILYTLRACLSMSLTPMKTTHSMPNRAAAVAVATPCCPAPVSAMRRVLPIFFARRACPKTLFILWAPVWLRSSLLR